MGPGHASPLPLPDLLVRNDKRNISAYYCRLRKISVYLIAMQSFGGFCGVSRCAF